MEELNSGGNQETSECVRWLPQHLADESLRDVMADGGAEVSVSGHMKRVAPPTGGARWAHNRVV